MPWTCVWLVLGSDLGQVVAVLTDVTWNDICQEDCDWCSWNIAEQLFMSSCWLGLKYTQWELCHKMAYDILSKANM
jgi:hypothetical protein